MSDARPLDGSIVDKHWQALAEQPALAALLRQQAGACRRACQVSDFLADNLARHGAELLPLFGLEPPSDNDELCAEWRWLAGSARIDQPLAMGVILSEMQQRVEGCTQESDLQRILRRLRRLHQFRLIWRDLVERVSYEQTVAELSAVADTLIDCALNWHYQDLCKLYGTPRDADGQPQRLVVLGMGKLGARELNISSDIDLIFTFPRHGDTDGARSLDNQGFFTRLGQRLITTLDKVTADGFVFRVDMRLRPYGSSGALALSFTAMEEYYEDQGRDWERYAFVKARPVAGDREAGERLLERLKAFVYRRYIDFGAIESLRSMKEMIQREVQRKGLHNNIKLGAGGIREVEFIVQAFQLVRGGREPSLQTRGLLTALEAVGKLALMPESAVEHLRKAYVFLRNLEHALQGLADRQTQTLPDDETSLARIACAMGYPDWQTLAVDLTAHRARVSEEFGRVIVERRGGSGRAESPHHEWLPLWTGEWTAEESISHLASRGCPEAEAIHAQVAELRDSSRLRHLQAQGRARVDQFVPLLLWQMVEARVSAETCGRLLGFVEAVMRRTAYLVLLLENPGALRELARLFSESSFVAEQILGTPLLLDELLHAESLYSPPDTATLRDELRQVLLRIPDDDLEEQMEVLRYFRKAHVLRVAASDLRGTLPLMKVSDYLTFLAETILQEVVDLAWREMERRYGRPALPPERQDSTDVGTWFGVIGYGKLGGIELSYGSDLDLVYLHGAATDQVTTGDQAIDNQVFFARLSQRLIHLLNTRTASGELYEIDMRLRPSGNSGMMVSSLTAFEKYQQQDAWTWEHQALVRARFVAGCPHIRDAFEAIRRRILCQPRDPGKLLAEVLGMREKMRESLATRPDREGRLPYFDLKQDSGGIVDIEFMVQYMALRWAHEYPDVIRWSDNIRILDSLAEAGRLTREEAERLCEIYRQLRARGHRLALQNQPARVPLDEFARERAQVQDSWLRLMA